MLGICVYDIELIILSCYFCEVFTQIVTEITIDYTAFNVLKLQNIEKSRSRKRILLFASCLLHFLINTTQLDWLNIFWKHLREWVLTCWREYEKYSAKEAIRTHFSHWKIYPNSNDSSRFEFPSVNFTTEGTVGDTLSWYLVWVTNGLFLAILLFRSCSVAFSHCESLFIESGSKLYVRTNFRTALRFFHRVTCVVPNPVVWSPPWLAVSFLIT